MSNQIKMGFLTNALVWAGMSEYADIAAWAKQSGFNDLEVGPTIPQDQAMFEKIAEETGIMPQTFIYCRNLLDPKEGEMHKKNLIDRIEMASRLGMKTVVTTTGITPASTVEGNAVKYDPEASLDAVVENFKPILELAEKKDIRIAYELCPNMFNIAISPYMLDLLFERMPSDHLGICLDPSHLIWEMIDVYDFAKEYAHKIYHVHGKDGEVDEALMKRQGILHTVHVLKEEEDHGEGRKSYTTSWHRDRLPGLGILDWGKIIAPLKEAGFDGTISIEHEDPIWCGSVEKIQHGILLAKEHLEQFI